MTTLATLPSGAAAGAELADLMAANRAAARAAVSRIHTPTRAVVYTRSSYDNEQTSETTANQEVAGRALADQRGVPVVGVYTDDDRSAYHLVVRDDFERMLRDARASAFDVVIVRHTDRLYRRLTDLSRIVEELTPYAVVWAVYEGPIDLTTAGGIMMAQIKGAVAEHASRIMGERIANHNLYRAENGWMNASCRPFGWAWAHPCDGVPRESGGVCDHNPNRPHPPGDRPILRHRGGVVPHPTEGPALATAYMMAAEGRSIRSISQWLRAGGFTGARGGALAPDHVRRILEIPRHAGLVAHKGKLLTEATDGLRIVDVDLWQRVQRIFDDPTRRTTPGRPAGTLLSGIARCGECGGPMNATNTRTVAADGTVTKRPAYICRTRNELRRRRELVDARVVDIVAAIIDESAERLREYAAAGVDDEIDPTVAESERLRARLAEYDALDAAEQIDPADYAAAKRRIRARLDEIGVRAARIAGRPALAALLATPEPVAMWREMATAVNPDPARAVLRELLDRVVVQPPAVRGRPTDTDFRIEGGWFDPLGS